MLQTFHLQKEKFYDELYSFTRDIKNPNIVFK